MAKPQRHTEKLRKDVETQNFGPHRRPTFALGPPALVLNLGFWNPYLQQHREQLKGATSTSTLREKREQWCCEIDVFLCKLLNHLHAQTWVSKSVCLVRDEKNNPDLIDSFAGSIRRLPSTPSVFECRPDKRRSAKFDVVTFEFTLADSPFQLHLMAERRHEYWTLVFCISLDTFPCPTTITDVFRAALGKDKRACAFFDGLLAVWSDLRLSDLHKHKADLATFWYATPPATGNPGKKTRTELAYDVCVEQFDDFVHSLIEGLYEENKVGHRHARFVGNLFWLPYDGERAPLDDELLKHAEDELWKPRRQILRPRLALGIGLGRDFQRSAYPKDASVLRQVWPLITHMQGRDLGGPTLDGREIVACYFLNRRALFASSLAKMGPMDADGRPPRVVYSMFLAMEDRWQIGRLVDRIFSCGSARLAAMREFNFVLKAGDRLHEIEDELFTTSNGANGFTQGVRDKIEYLFGQIDSDFVEYRVEGAQHYWEQFHALLVSLREKRIEGFQPYGQFVARRLSGSIDLIGSIGRRHQVTREEVDLRYQIEQTTNLVRLQEQLVRLQRVGEVFATISIGYYISSWLAGTLKDKHDTLELCAAWNWMARAIGWSKEATCSCRQSPYFVGALTAGALYVGYHFYRKLKKIREQRLQKQRLGKLQKNTSADTA